MNIFYFPAPCAVSWTEKEGGPEYSQEARLVCTVDDTQPALIAELSDLTGEGVYVEHFNSPVELSLVHGPAATTAATSLLIAVSKEASAEYAIELHDKLKAKHAALFLKTAVEPEDQ